MQLHEIEIHSSNPEESKKFYHEILGLPVALTKDALTVYKSGRQGVDLNTSNHFSEKTSLSFLVKDIEQTAAELREKGCTFTGPEETHLGMQEIVLHDPDGNRIAIHAPGNNSPDWLKNMV